MTTPRRGRDTRGAAFPSPVVILSIIAVAMAAVAFFATRGAEPAEREITPAAAPSGSPSSTPPSAANPKSGAKKGATKKAPVVRRGQVNVVVFNNSGITGLASGVASTVTDAGWTVVGSDNWYGSIPANTVYYPKRLKAAAEQLALDLGISRTALAVDPMQFDRLTVILTSPID